MASKLQLYVDDADFVVARSPEDACTVWAECIGATYADETGRGPDAWSVIADDKPFPLNDLDHPEKPPEVLTAAQWIAKEGRGFLGSSDY